MAPRRMARPCPERSPRELSLRGQPPPDTARTGHAVRDRPAARRSRIESLLPHARRIARREARRTRQDFDDVFSDACLGAIAAVDSFDGKHGRTLSQYAERRIRGAILDGLRRRDWASRALRGRLKTGQSAARSPLSLDALAAELDGSRPDGSAGGLALADIVADPRDDFALVDDRYEAVHLRRWVQGATATLPPREALVIRQHLGGRTMRQIGAELAVTEARVSQLRKRAIALLRDRGLRDPRLTA
ncbi:MAG: sigma-70 family RNA polymerase sigma factor [Actinomycetota bacterium]|nr:sigma-70 family RNA polymerase sigma factor [Actinomycetota bacterium]